MPCRQAPPGRSPLLVMEFLRSRCTACSRSATYLRPLLVSAGLLDEIGDAPAITNVDLGKLPDTSELFVRNSKHNIASRSRAMGIPNLPSPLHSWFSITNPTYDCACTILQESISTPAPAQWRTCIRNSLYVQISILRLSIATMSKITRVRYISNSLDPRGRLDDSYGASLVVHSLREVV